MQALVREYEAGVSADVLAETHGISRHGVLNLLHEEGVQMRRRPLNADQIDTCVQRYLAGSTLREIQADLGLPKSTVREALQRRGVVMRAAGRRRPE